MLTVRKVGSIIEKLKEMLEEYLEKTKPKYYPPVENLLDLVYEWPGKPQRKKKRNWKHGFEACRGWMRWLRTTE